MNLVSAKCPNQLMQISGQQSYISNEIIFTNNADGSYTITTSEPVPILRTILLNANLNTVEGHKYVVVGGASGGSYSTYRVRWFAGLLDDWGNGNIATMTSQGVSYPQCKIELFVGATLNNVIFKPQLIDLTELYGSGNEPSTVAQFKADFPLDYYPYRATSQDVLLTANNAPITVPPSAVLPSEIGYADMGDTVWSYDGEKFYTHRLNFAPDFPTVTSNDDTVWAFCKKYKAVARSKSANETIFEIASNGNVCVQDSAYTDAQSFKSAMSGVLLFYKKA